MKIGDIVLFRKVPSSWLSKAIALATKSSYTHAGIIYDITNEDVITAEALAQGFTLVHRNRAQFHADIENRDLELLSPKYPLVGVKEFINHKLGRPYGYLDLLAILIYVITGKMLFKGTTSSLICSEAVALVLKQCSNGKLDLEKEYNKPISYITPDDLFMSKQLK